MEDKLSYRQEQELKSMYSPEDAVAIKANLNKIIIALRYAEIEFRKDIHVFLADSDGNRPNDHMSGMGCLLELFKEKTINSYLMEKLIPLVQYPYMDYKINLSNPDVFEFKIPILIGDPFSEQQKKYLNMSEKELEAFKLKMFGR